MVRSGLRGVPAIWLLASHQGRDISSATHLLHQSINARRAWREIRYIDSLPALDGCSYGAYLQTILETGKGNGGAEEDRTPDLRIANATLSQLSYRPISSCERKILA